MYKALYQAAERWTWTFISLFFICFTFFHAEIIPCPIYLNVPKCKIHCYFLKSWTYFCVSDKGEPLLSSSSCIIIHNKIMLTPHNNKSNFVQATKVLHVSIFKFFFFYVDNRLSNGHSLKSIPFMLTVIYCALHMTGT